MSGGQWGILRTVVSETAVSDLVDQSCQTYPRLREAWDALEWLLSRAGATVGRPPNSGDESFRLYVQADDPLANIPAIWVLYRIGESIDILAVNLVAPVEDSEI